MCRHTKFYLVIGHIGTKTINLSRSKQRHHIILSNPVTAQKVFLLTVT
jgi:hypothetical protein